MLPAHQNSLSGGPGYQAQLSVVVMCTMSPYLMPGLGPKEASKICMETCQAMCCRGPLLLALDSSEVQAFQEDAAKLGLKVTIQGGLRDGGWLKFADYEGERCPMLEPETWACRIYERRPRRCREFPERWTPGCAISGG